MRHLRSRHNEAVIRLRHHSPGTARGGVAALEGEHGMSMIDLVLDYGAWTDLLFEQLHEGVSGETVFFHVDDQLLNEIGDDEGVADGVSSFLTAVRINTEGFTDLGFKRVVQRSQIWAHQGYEGSPPMLPVLGLSVMAATRMRRHSSADRTIASTNYYRWLNELVQDLTAAGQPRWMPRVEELWRLWETWLLDSNGRFGKPALPQVPRQRFVAPPMSQALWRRADNRLLREYLTTMGWAGSATSLPERSVVLESVRSWARATFSGARLAFFEDQDYTDAVMRIVESAAERPPLRRDRVRGGRAGSPNRSPLRLTISSPPRPRLSMFGERLPGWPATLKVATDDGKLVTLTAGSGSVYPWDQPVDNSLLNEGLSLEAEGDRRLVLLAERMYVFQQDPLIGDYAHVGGLDTSAKFLLVAPRFMDDEVRQDLDRLGIRFSTAPLEGLPDGWTFYKCRAVGNVKGFVPEWIADLLPSDVEQLQFTGGLRPDNRTSTYLTGHPPRVVAGPETEVVVNHQSVGRTDGEGRFDLRELDFLPGQHEVQVGSAAATIQLVDRGLPEHALRRGRRGQRWKVEGGRLKFVGIGIGHPDELVIDGANVPQALQPRTEQTGHPVAVNGSVLSIILGNSPGELQRFSPRTTPVPSWFRHAGLFSTDTTVHTPFEPVWRIVAINTPAGEVVLSAETIRCTEVSPTPIAGVLTESWATTIVAARPPTDVGANTWSGYLEVARDLINRRPRR